MKYFGHHVRTWSRREQLALIVGFVILAGILLVSQQVFGAPDVTVNSQNPLTLPTAAYCNMSTYICDFNTLTVNNNGTVTVNSDLAGNRHVIIRAAQVTVFQNGKITADGKGYPQGQGPGAGANNPSAGGVAPGGGHGGAGGRTDQSSLNGGLANDFLLTATNFGSGGGDTGGTNVGGAGGGIIEFILSGPLVVDGTISAHGAAGQSFYGGPNPKRSYVGGGGSGGTILIVAQNLSGNGSIGANGGQAGAFQTRVAGGGGGGLVFINLTQPNVLAPGQPGYEAGDPIHNTFSPISAMISRLTTTGGSADGNETWRRGDEGGVALYASATQTLLVKGLMYVRQGGFPNGGNTPISVTALGFGADFITTTGSFVTRVIELPSGNQDGGVNWEIANELIINKSILTSQGDNQQIVLTAGSVSLENTSRIQPSYFDKGLTNGYPTDEYNTTGLNSSVSLTANTLTVSADSVISTYRTGYGRAAGPGASAAQMAGGGYGGAGGSSLGGGSGPGGAAYGGEVANLTMPILAGSGGANGPSQGRGGRGGGVLSIAVTGTLTNQGVIEAAGQAGTNFAGGAAGGSIFTRAGAVAGAGRIATNGGQGGGTQVNQGSGGGGGGRLAVLYGTCAWSNHAISSTGATGSWAGGTGGAGSVYYQSTQVPTSPTVTKVDHSGGTWTTGPTVFPFGDLTFTINTYTGCNAHLASQYSSTLDARVHWELRLAGGGGPVDSHQTATAVTGTNQWAVAQAALTAGNDYTLRVWYSDVAGVGVVRTFNFSVEANAAIITTIDGRDPETYGARYDTWPPTDIPPQTVPVDGVDPIEGQLPFDIVGSGTGGGTWFFAEFESWNPADPEAGKIAEWIETSGSNTIQPTRDSGADQFIDLSHWFLVRYAPTSQPSNVSPYYYFTFTPTQPPWLQVNRGDIYSGGAVTLTNPPLGQYSALYCVSSVGMQAITPGDAEFVDCQQSGLPPLIFPKTANNYFSPPFGSLDPDDIIARATAAGTLVTTCSLPSQLNGQVYLCDAPTALTLPATTISDSAVRGNGTLIVRGDLTISGDITYAAATATTINRLASLGVMVIKRADGSGGNIAIQPAVGQIVGTYYAEDTIRTCSGFGSCSQSPLIIRGSMAAHRFQFQRLFISFTDLPAEQFIYDGRSLANVPPGFEQFVKGLPKW
ncbi:MAG: hypothetical protein AAB817_01130 [Patescibacteria group bacterium]